MYFTKAKQLWEQYRTDIPLIPTPLATINELEQQLGFQFPAAYREFLLWSGNGYNITYNVLPALAIKTHQQIREFLQKQDVPLNLPANAFVFYVRENLRLEFFCYFLCDGTPDPPVHNYEAARNKFYLNLSPHFSECMTHEIAYYLEKEFPLKFKYLNSLEARYNSFGLPQPQGCSKAAVIYHEKEFDAAFPAAYCEFLLWMGRDAQSIFSTALYQGQELVNINELARKWLSAETFPQPLDENEALVFWMSPDKQEFRFFWLNAEDDPPIYIYKKGLTSESFLQTHQHFSLLLAEEIEAAIKRLNS